MTANRVRWQETMRKRPWFTLSTIVAVVGLITAVPTLRSYLPNWQTVEAAEQVVKELRAEAKAHADVDARNQAASEKYHTESLYGQQNILTTILRNAAATCGAQATTKGAREACEMSKLEYQEAATRNRILYQKTLNESVK